MLINGKKGRIVTSQWKTVADTTLLRGAESTRQGVQHFGALTARHPALGQAQQHLCGILVTVHSLRKHQPNPN